jgi:hypothetical protein
MKREFCRTLNIYTIAYSQENYAANACIGKIVWKYGNWDHQLSDMLVWSFRCSNIWMNTAIGGLHTVHLMARVRAAIQCCFKVVCTQCWQRTCQSRLIATNLGMHTVCRNTCQSPYVTQQVFTQYLQRYASEPAQLWWIPRSTVRKARVRAAIKPLVDYTQYRS